MDGLLAQNLISKKLASNLFTLTVSYDRIFLTPDYHGAIENDPYGRPSPKSSHGSARTSLTTFSLEKITQAILSIYDRITDKNLYIRRFNISAENVIPQKEEQQDLFTDLTKQRQEISLQNTMLEIQKKIRQKCNFKGQ